MIMMMVMMILVKPQDAQGDKERRWVLLESCKPGLFLPRTRPPSWRDAVAAAAGRLELMASSVADA